MKEETAIKWYTSDKIPKLDSTVLVEFKDKYYTSFNSMTVYGAGYFEALKPELEEDNIYYNLIMYDGGFIEFENKKEFTSIVKRWCYLE